MLSFLNYECVYQYLITYKLLKLRYLNYSYFILYYSLFYLFEYSKYVRKLYLNLYIEIGEKYGIISSSVKTIAIYSTLLICIKLLIIAFNLFMLI